MIYPSVGQYTEAIKLAEQSPEDYFATLTTLRPVLDEDNNPVMSSGNFAVVSRWLTKTTASFTPSNASPATKMAETKVIGSSPTNFKLLSIFLLCKEVQKLDISRNILNFNIF